MISRRARTVSVAATAALSVAALAGCGGGNNNPLATGSSSVSGGSSSAASGGGSVIVGSADFSESVVLAELYAGALKKKGINASTKPRIGSREVYLKALDDGSIQVIPEYTGALALYYKKDFAETDPQKVYDALPGIVPATMQVLAKSSAEDKDSITVTKETAQKYGLSKVSDVAAHASEMTLGAPDEFKTRTQGIPGLTKVYGITFGQVRTPLSGQAAVTALKNGQIQAANIFTTDPAIKANGFVALDDDKRLFGTQNVVPLVAKKAVTPELTQALDAVSAKLTTDELQTLMGKVDLDKQDAAKVAQDWLSAQGIG